MDRARLSVLPSLFQSLVLSSSIYMCVCVSMSVYSIFRLSICLSQGVLVGYILELRHYVDIGLSVLPAWSWWCAHTLVSTTSCTH